MMQPQSDIISVGELNAYIKSKFASDGLLSNLWIRGEISNFVHHSSGHMYFTLKDDASRIKGVMFMSNARTLTFEPLNGMKVIARGYVSVYERDGQYQFYAQEILPDGIGQLYLAYEQLKKKLESEGLFRTDIKKALPKYPHKIGIVTSPTGAAIRDIITTIKRRYPLVELLVAPTAVQGTGAASAIAESIRLLNQEADIDLIIVGRGGGSIEELWAFNEEVVARAIYHSRVPVISAVGHETDYTIADFVADVRAATPTAAAEIAVPNIAELSKGIHSLEQRLNFYIIKYLETAQLKLRRLLDSVAFKRPEQRIIDEQQRIDNLLQRLSRALSADNDQQRVANLVQRLRRVMSVDNEQQRIANLLQRLIREAQVANRGYSQRLLVLKKQLVALSPLNVLNRGYAIAYNEKREIISSVHSVHKEEQLSIRLNDGQIISVVKAVEEDKHVEN